MIKDYLIYENERNHRDHKVQEDIVKACWGDQTEVMVAHHITFEVDPGANPIEIPSADTLIFDHDIMGKVFGASSIGIMVALAGMPAGERDAFVASKLADRQKMQEAVNAQA